MMQSEINRKIASNSEDNLTSYFLSAFRYFTNNELLITFLREASKINGQKLILNEIKSTQVYFWPKFNFPGTNNREADGILILEEENGRKLGIVIEVKYNAGLSNMPDEIIEDKHKLVENIIKLGHQLSDEYCGIMCGQWLHDGLQDQLMKSDLKLLIYITSNYEFPVQDIDQAIINIKKRKCKNKMSFCNLDIFEIYWLSWRTLYTVINKFKYHQPQNCQLGKNTYFYDLLEIMNLRDLKEFKPFKNLIPIVDYESYFLPTFWRNITSIPQYVSFLKT